MPGHTKCCTCHAKSSQQTGRFDAPKCNPSREMSALTSEHPWWTRHASLQILFKCPTPAIVSGNAAKPSRFAHFWQGAQSFAPTTRNDIWTSKSRPNPWCFVHFDSEMCFAPQRRALFLHLNFQKWSQPGVFCTFWLGNLRRATTACNFLSLIWPAGSAPAALASLLFDPPETQIIGKKHSVSRLSYLFAHLHLLSSDSFSSTLLSSNLFPSLCLCPALLFICPYCRKFDFLNFLR